MMSKVVVAVALIEEVAAFQAPAMKASPKAVKASMFEEGDLGVLPPLGVFDPLGLIEKRDMKRYEIMEIKHGRAAMLGFVHVILIHAGVRFPGYLSPSNGLKFADMPTDCFASLEAVPTAGWLAIMLTCCMTETGAIAAQEAGGQRPNVEFPILGGVYWGTPQTVDKAPGDIAGEGWFRYDDPEVKAFKLNAERNNGRAAMLGVTGCLIHELLRRSTR